jgi:hypothetical protein
MDEVSEFQKAVIVKTEFDENSQLTSNATKIDPLTIAVHTINPTRVHSTKTASINASDPHDDEYAVCTTTQYDLCPSTNSSTLAVLLQATDAITAAQTAEQMRQQAQDNGWLSVYSKWGWWYPWYRLHLKVSVNSTVVDVGFNPILPFGETYSWKGLETLASVLSDVAQDVTTDVVAMFGQYLVAKAFEFWNPVASVITETGKFFTQLALLVWQEWNDKTGLLISAVVSFVMGLTALVADFGRLFLQALFRIVGGMTSTGYMFASLFDELSKMLVYTRIIARGWVDALELSYDWITAGIALYRWSQLT